MSRRTERVGEQLRGEIARVLHEELRDPRIGFVTLTRIDVAPDLSHAVVYWSRVEAEEEGADLEEAARGLASAAGFVRHRLAQVLPLRRVPELRFRHDPSMELGARTLAVLRDLDRGGETPER